MKPKQVRRTLERLGNETVLPAKGAGRLKKALQGKQPVNKQECRAAIAESVEEDRELLNNGADTENTAPNQQEIA